jgi:hypothetical protein
MRMPQRAPAPGGGRVRRARHPRAPDRRAARGRQGGGALGGRGGEAGGPGRLGAARGARRPGRAERVVAQPGAGLGGWGAGAAPLVGGAGPGSGGPGRSRPPDMAAAAAAHASDQEELVEPQVRCHDHRPFPAGARGLVYGIDSRWNYPLPGGTAPAGYPAGRWLDQRPSETCAHGGLVHKRPADFR